MHYGIIMKMIMIVMKKQKMILFILGKESLSFDDNEDKNNASTART